MANFLSCARGPHWRAESKFVKLELYDQVDFCPFRGPEAPFALEDISTAELLGSQRGQWPIFRESPIGGLWSGAFQSIRLLHRPESTAKDTILRARQESIGRSLDVTSR